MRRPLIALVAAVTLAAAIPSVANAKPKDYITGASGSADQASSYISAGTLHCIFMASVTYDALPHRADLLVVQWTRPASAGGTSTQSSTTVLNPDGGTYSFGMSEAWSFGGTITDTVSAWFETKNGKIVGSVDSIGTVTVDYTHLYWDSCAIALSYP